MVVVEGVAEEVSEAAAAAGVAAQAVPLAEAAALIPPSSWDRT